MSYKVICLSTVDGSGADQIGPLVAERLGFQLVNEEIVAIAAREADIDPRLVADVERRKSLVGRVLERLGPSAAAAGAMGAYIPDMSQITSPDETALRDIIRSTIDQLAEQGRVVIVAHAASFALCDRLDTLRVFVTASPQTRGTRLEADGDAGKRLAKLDANRADYLKRFYDVGAEQPYHYDLVVNTDRLDAETAAGIITALAS